MRSRASAPQIRLERPAPSAPRAKIRRAKRNRANCSSLSGKRFEATEDRGDYRPAFTGSAPTEVMHPISISRELAQENQDRLALPSYNRQHLSGIRRGWCPPQSRELTGAKG